MSALTVVSALLLRSSVHGQERRLLDERATELSAYLKSSGTQAATSLSAIADAIAVSGAGSPLFTSLATPLTAQGATVGVAQRSGGHFGTVAVLGDQAQVGKPLNDLQQSVIERATHGQGLVLDLATSSGVRHVVEAIGATGHTSVVAFLDSQLPTTARPIPTTKDSP